jgi:hypothetical protein
MTIDLDQLAATLLAESMQLEANSASLIASAQALKGLVDALMRDGDLPYIDRVADMPTNDNPFHPSFLRWFPGRKTWPERNLDTLTGITIHHTLSHSPVATARYCTMTKGYPTTQYHYWVSAGDGCPVYKLVEPSAALWHDHTGAHPTTLSVGMAGWLHTKKPPDEQIEAAARVVAWLLGEYDIPRNGVNGHAERAIGVVTVCPGWNTASWRDDFFAALDSAIARR